MKNILFAIIFAVVLQIVVSEDASTTPQPPAPPPLETVPAPPPIVEAPPPTLPEAQIAASKKDKIVICNYNNILPTSRSDKYTVADVDSSLCSHVIYNSVTLDPKSLTIQIESMGSDFDNILALKQKGVAVLLSLGGNTDPTLNENLSRMVNDGAARSNFVKDTLRLLKARKLDGLDVNWNFPGRLGRLGDKGNFVNLLRDLSAAFKFDKLLVTATVFPSIQLAESAYSVRGIARFVDYINLQTFDLNDQSYATTAIHSAFASNGTAPSVAKTVEFWMEMGSPVEKLVLGIPTFGRTFSLQKDTENAVGSPAAIGKPTGLGVPGIAAYFEVCTGLDYQFVEGVGSYAYKADQWVSFDDMNTIKLKGEYIKKQNLAGAAITSLDTDDYSGTLCNQGKYPLIRTLRGALGLQ